MTPVPLNPFANSSWWHLDKHLLEVWMRATKFISECKTSSWFPKIYDQTLSDSKLSPSDIAAAGVSSSQCLFSLWTVSLELGGFSVVRLTRLPSLAPQATQLMRWLGRPWCSSWADSSWQPHVFVVGRHQSCSTAARFEPAMSDPPHYLNTNHLSLTSGCHNTRSWKYFGFSSKKAQIFAF